MVRLKGLKKWLLSSGLAIVMVVSLWSSSVRATSVGALSGSNSTTSDYLKTPSVVDFIITLPPSLEYDGSPMEYLLGTA